MGKLMPLLIFIIVVELAMMLFLGVSTPSTALLSLFLNPTSWSSLALITKITSVIALAGVGGIIVGTFVNFKSDFLIFAGLTTVFLSYGQSLYAVYSKIQGIKDLGDWSTLIALLIVSPIIIVFIYTILKFWRGND